MYPYNPRTILEQVRALRVTGGVERHVRTRRVPRQSQ